MRRTIEELGWPVILPWLQYLYPRGAYTSPELFNTDFSKPRLTRPQRKRIPIKCSTKSFLFICYLMILKTGDHQDHLFHNFSFTGVAAVQKRRNIAGQGLLGKDLRLRLDRGWHLGIWYVTRSLRREGVPRCRDRPHKQRDHADRRPTSGDL